MTIETGAGVKDLQLFIRESAVFSVLVDMGKPAFAPEQVPVKLDGDRVMDREVFLAGENRRISCLSMGNPHVVQFVDDVARISLEHVGPAIETDPLFPERVNVSFATVLERNIIKMRVWERGIGADGGLRYRRVRSGGCRCGKWPVRPGYGYLRSFAWGRAGGAL